ncbi:1-pyrroline-5-carboxylate dehydrogenase [Pestalotiopsis sp. IQ-011]
MAGGAAGITNSVISGPIEHLRIRMQTQPRGDARLYSGPLDAARKIVQSAGVSGLYRGRVVTLMREFHGYGVWFAAYEGFVSVFTKHGQCARDDLPKWKFALCGGLAGEALWLLSHPLDVLKSKMQSDGFGGTQEYRNLRDVVRKTWMRYGIGGFFEGLGPALLRAAPVSAGTFATVEVVRQALG